LTYLLYGTPGSLYTGKARSYLIKQGIRFDSRAAGEPRFRAEIVPRIGRWIIPVLECPDGEIIQDGSEIIEHFESNGQALISAYPATPIHRLVSQIFELFGGEGLLRPAMHYRWNFDETNRAFLSQDFPAALAPTGVSPEAQAEIFALSSGRMRKAMAGFGVSPDTIPDVEASYQTFLDLFETHLEASPYLLGGAPTLGDYGLIAPLYAHLGRDPYPARIMQQTAYRVWRWVERMNASGQDAGEYGAPPETLFADDGIPQTLKALLAFIAEDYLPEVEAYVGYTRTWLANHPSLETGTNGMPRPQDRGIGRMDFLWLGHNVSVNVMPYRIYLLQKVQAVFDLAAPEARTAMQALLDETGLSKLLTLRTQRQVVRHNNLEVWGPEVG